MSCCRRGTAATLLGLSLLTAAGGCSDMPELLIVRFVDGTATRLSDAEGVRVEGSFTLELTAPPQAETTELLLLDLRASYDNACGSAAPLTRVSLNREQPLTIEPGERTTLTVSFVAGYPTAAGCSIAQQLQLYGSYYDSVADDYLGRSSEPFGGSIALSGSAIGDPPSSWTCLGEAVEPPYQAGASTGLVTLRELTTRDIIPGIRVRVCVLADPSCGDPVDAGYTDIVGTWPLTVPTSGPYYFEVSGQAGIVDSLFFEHAPPGEAGFEQILTPFYEHALVQALAAGGLSPDPTRGHLALTAVDCDGHAGVGASFELGTAVSGTTLYWQDGAPVPGATETSGDAFALLANVPPGQDVVVTARLAVTGEVITSRPLHVRPGNVSFLQISPGLP